MTPDGEALAGPGRSSGPRTMRRTVALLAAKVASPLGLIEVAAQEWRDFRSGVIGDGEVETRYLLAPGADRAGPPPAPVWLAAADTHEVVRAINGGMHVHRVAHRLAPGASEPGRPGRSLSARPGRDRVRTVMATAAARPVAGRLIDGPFSALGWLVERAAAAATPRTLYLMRAPRDLPGGPAIPWRPFDAAADIDEMAAISEGVFGWHPGLDGYDRDGLLARTRVPSFDPSLVLVHEIDGRLAGYCWCVVSGPDDPVGTLVDLAVHPDFAGRGIGRRLLLAGLTELRRRSRHPVTLYVDAANLVAVRLYVESGCIIWRVEHDWRVSEVTYPAAPDT